jgi:hypothetical protein
MRTLVFQSYRTFDVPAVLERSMRSVRDWASARGPDYAFHDDTFFDAVPAWYRDRVPTNKLVLANLARLVVAKRALEDGYDRAIWIDADIVVFAPDLLEVTTKDGFTFCRETFVERRGGPLRAGFRVNNAVCAFDRGNRFLEFAIWAHETLVRDRPDRVYHFGTSTVLLTQLYVATPFPLVQNVGLFTPAMVRELAGTGDGPAVQELKLRHGHPIYAANLTHSMAGVEHDGVVATAEDYLAATERLIATRGAPFVSAGDHAAPADSSAQSRGTR